MTCTILSLLSHLSVMPKSKVRLQGSHSVAVAASTNKLTVATCRSLKRFSELPLRLRGKQVGYVWIKSRNQDLTMTFQMSNSWAPGLAKSVFCLTCVRPGWSLILQTLHQLVRSPPTWKVEGGESHLGRVRIWAFPNTWREVADRQRVGKLWGVPPRLPIWAFYPTSC